MGGSGENCDVSYGDNGSGGKPAFVTSFGMALTMKQRNAARQMGGVRGGTRELRT